MNDFSYSSNQVHVLVRNGKGMTRKHSVVIKHGKGTKSVKHFSNNGTYLGGKTKHLTRKEISCIKKHRFIPGFFNDCITPLRINRKTRRNKNK
jgi:hypothetical protein